MVNNLHVQTCMNIVKNLHILHTFTLSSEEAQVYTCSLWLIVIGQVC